MVTLAHAATKTVETGSDAVGFLFYILVGALLFVLFLLLVRELITWYWKINQIVRLLERIEENTHRDIAKADTAV